MNLLTIFRKKNSGEIAKNRLKLILISEKTNCSPEILERIKEDIMLVISKYMEIDSAGIEVRMTKTTRAGHKEAVPALYANIPIREITYKRTC